MNSDTIDISILNAAVTASTAKSTKVAPTGWNGSLGTVDMAKPVDYTGDWGKIVTTASGENLDASATMRYYVWLVQNKPATNAPVALSQENVTRLIPHVRQLIARFRIYKLFHLTGKTIEFRKSDVLDASVIPDDGDTSKAGSRRRIVLELYGILTETEEMEQKIAEIAHMTLLETLGGAIHRDLFDDHTWFTKDMDQPRAPTSKILQIAGRKKVEFKQHMKKNGHDKPHHIATKSLRMMAEIIGQEKSAVIPAACSEDYRGETLGGKDLKDLLYCGEATKGRYPANSLGGAAVIVGLSMMDAMIVHITTVAKVEGAESISSHAGMLKDFVAKPGAPRPVVLAIGRQLQGILSQTYGFMLAAKHIAEGEYAAFANHANRSPADVKAGRVLAITLRRCAPHKEAITGALKTVLVKMSNTLQAAGRIPITSAAGAPACCAMGGGVDSDKLRVAVGAISGVAPDVFYDADEGA